MPLCFFASDLHGRVERYQKLFERIAAERPRAVFLGGDLLPAGLGRVATLNPAHQDFLNGYIGPQLARLREALAGDYPQIFVILGNDDPRSEEASVLSLAAQQRWHYAHERRLQLGDLCVYGYAYVSPSPFLNKDWERYDVSRYVDPGCVSPEDGYRSVPVSISEQRYTTIHEDLARLTEDADLRRAIMLFHCPPYRTCLDRAALDGKMIDHVPLDVHVGSVAIRRLIEERQPLLTLHGHIHEAARITGAWREHIGRTWCFGGAHDGDELALVRFEPEQLDAAERELI